MGPSSGAKRRSISQAQGTSRRAKRQRSISIYDEAAHVVLSSQICAQRRKQESILRGDDLLRSSSQIPIWGAKRSSQISICGVKRPRGTLISVPLLGSSQIPACGAKRARIALVSGTLLPDPPEWRDWTNLGDGPAGLIAERLLASDVADYICFRAVCRPWRLCTTDPREHDILDRRFHPHQWIMLRATRSRPYRRCFMNVSAGYCRDVDLPEFREHEVFGPTTEGLLVLLDRITTIVRLLNPLTRQVADLPPASTLLSQNDLKRAKFTEHLWLLLEVSGAGLANDDSIAIHFRGIKTIVVGKPGDLHWTVVDRGRWFLQAMSSASRFYCATNGAVMVVDTGANQPPHLAVAAKLTRPLSMMMMDSLHLVDIKDELMLVDHERKGHGYTRYKAYRIDMDSRTIVPAHGLGGHALFIGLELALSVSQSVFPSISADAIYLGFDLMFTDSLVNGPIHLINGTSKPHHLQDSTQFDGNSQFEDSNNNMLLNGPLGVDIYLSRCVSSYHVDLSDM